MNNDTKARFSDPDLWIRLLYMILFAALTWLSRLVLCVIGLLQFLVVLLSGAENRSLRDFSASLAEWTLRSFRFICFNTEQKPFPFDEWPEPDAAVADTVIALPAGDVVFTEDPGAPAEEGVVTVVETTVAEVETAVAETDLSAGETQSPVTEADQPASGDQEGSGPQNRDPATSSDDPAKP